MIILIIGLTISLFSGLVSVIDKWKNKSEDSRYKKKNLLAFLTFLLAILGASLTFHSGKSAIQSNSLKDSLNNRLTDTLKTSQTKLLQLQQELYNKTTGGDFRPQVFPLAQGIDKLKFMLYNPSPYTLSDIEIDFPKEPSAFHHQTEIVTKANEHVEKTLFYPILYPDRAFDDIYSKQLPKEAKGEIAVVVRWRYSFYSVLISWEKAEKLIIKTQYIDNNGKEFVFENLKDIYK